MIDQTTINFFAKLTLACFVLSLCAVRNAECRAVQDQQRQYSGELSGAAGVPAVNQPEVLQQYQPQPYYQQGGSSPSVNYQYYDQQPQQSAQYQSFSNEIQGSSKNKPNRRSILSSIMAPFYTMRDQTMNMLQATLQGCDPNVFSMWCRFWAMFIRRR